MQCVHNIYVLNLQFLSKLLKGRDKCPRTRLLRLGPGNLQHGRCSSPLLLGANSTTNSVTWKFTYVSAITAPLPSPSNPSVNASEPSPSPSPTPSASPSPSPSISPTSPKSSPPPSPSPANQPPPETPVLAAKTGIKILILRTHLPTDCPNVVASSPTSTNQMWLELLRNASDFLSAHTAGQISYDLDNLLIANVSVPCFSPPNPKECVEENESKKVQLAIEAATTAGINIKNFDSQIIDLPANNCLWAGMGFVGGNILMLNNIQSLDVWALGTFVHEMGHNFGMIHPMSLKLTGTPPTSTPSEGSPNTGSDWSRTWNKETLHFANLPQMVAMKLSSPTNISSARLPLGQATAFSFKSYWFGRKEVSLLLAFDSYVYQGH